VSVKKLASDTLWYGVSNIAGRFLNYFLSTILLTYLFNAEQSAPISQVYAIIPFLNIVFTLGFETSYFRFSQTIEKQKLFNTQSSILILSTLIFTLLLFFNAASISKTIEMSRNVNYYFWMLFIVAFDALTILPFARLRQEGRPKKFALLKLLNIIFNIVFVIFYLILVPYLIKKGVALPAFLYHPEIGIGYYIVANLCASILQFIILLPQWIGYKFEIDFSLFKNIMSYSWPILIVGFGGMINDFLSRITYYKVLPSIPLKQLDHEFGVFSANYKLAALATIFIQVFKMAAEPFFFNQSKEKNAPETYARVTKIFVIICCYIFIAISMNLNILVLLIASKHKEFAEGIHIVPVLTIANIFLGIYYNLAIWYKITNNTLKGAAITIMGVVITIALNIALVPLFHYTGAAWATCACYFFMMVVSFFWGQKYYKIPYETLKLISYLMLVVSMYLFYTFITYKFNIHNFYIQFIAFAIIIAIFTLVVLKYDKHEFQSLPFIGKYLK
jgi:O-antigen/teichoic acid export membrane protein